MAPCVHSRCVRSFLVIAFLLLLRLRFCFINHDRGLCEQLHSLDFQRDEMLFVELIVVLIAILSAKQLEVLLADDDGARFRQ